MCTLKSLFKEVSTENPALVFLVRKIQTLGFHAHKKLREHYSHYGEVAQVLVAHRKLKGIPDAHGQAGLPRMRPGSLGFVIMNSQASVLQILAGGEDQCVAGHFIRVEAYEPKCLTWANMHDTTKDSDDTSTTAESFSNGTSDMVAPASVEALSL